MRLFIKQLAFVFTLSLFIGQSHITAEILTGPMLAHVDMREATVWVQLDSPAEVTITYGENGKSANSYRTTPVATNPTSNIAILKLDQVEPGKTYSYSIQQDGQTVSQPYTFRTPQLYKDRTPPPDFKFAVGGAHYHVQEGFEPPYQILGSSYTVFDSILQSKPQFMIWAGNTMHLRDSDWTTKAGYIKRHTHARQVPQLAKLLSAIPHYGTWGATDYSPIESGKNYSYRQYAQESFEEFWPRPVKINQLDGIATRFRYADVDFFILDVRSDRNLHPKSDQQPVIIGEEQTQWLRHELATSDATFKIIVSGAPMLNPSKKLPNISYTHVQQSRFLEVLREAEIPGLMFISGGKYFGELTKLVHANSYNLYDLTVGPLTAEPETKTQELNYFRSPGTSTFDRHFALLEVYGPEDDRHLTIRIKGIAGDELWNRTIKAKMLQPSASN